MYYCVVATTKVTKEAIWLEKDTEYIILHQSNYSNKAATLYTLIWLSLHTCANTSGYDFGHNTIQPCNRLHDDTSFLIQFLLSYY